VSGVLVGVLAYLALQLAFGFYVARRVASETDYLLAGRSLGWGLAIFTTFATWFGAETVIGAAGEAREQGLAGVIKDPFAYVVALVLFGLVFAAPLYRRRLVTLADLFRQRYGVATERLAVLLMVPTSVMWAAAQIRAFGQVLSHAGGLDVDLMITLAAAVVILYTTAGGLLADAWTDLVQGSVLIVGLVVLFVVLLAGGQLDPLAALPADRLSPLGPDQTWLDLAEAVVPVVCSSLVAQELIARALGARSVTVARAAPMIAGGVYLLVGVIPVVVGLATIGGHAGVEAEQVVMQVARLELPTLAYVVFAGALLSAILSTVDSALLVAGSLVAHNLVVPLRPGLDERGKLRVSRLAVGGFGVVAWALALTADSIYELVVQAAELGSAGIFVIVAFGLWSRRGGAASAIGALVVGAAGHLVGEALELRLPYLAALAGALVVFLALSVVGQRRQ
jgi:Na+/proline symporter